MKGVDWMLVAGLLAVTVIVAVVAAGEASDCEKRGGVLVKNYWGNPECVGGPK